MRFDMKFYIKSVQKVAKMSKKHPNSPNFAKHLIKSVPRGCDFVEFCVHLIVIPLGFYI